MSKIVVTGSAGRLGRATVTGLLRAGHTVVGFDRVPTPGLPASQSIVGSITDRAALEAAFAGADSVIHLAASPDDAKHPDGKITYDPNDFPDQLVPNNVLGTYYVLDAARVAQVPRVILASSGQVIDGHFETKQFPIKVEASFQPRYLYACTKVMLEQLGFVYSQHHGLSVLAVRLGWCPRDLGQVKEIASDPECQDVFLSPGDAGRFFAAAVAAILPPYSVCYATSLPTHQLTYDLSEAKRLLQWEPIDRWPTGAEAF
ncbi:MAG: NAD(P)-dependent oxidoreductase [Gemmataceae bacterium]